ncbi:hypothetical protein [Agitococcus lubricus]|uniref:Uncharacterized protein n=1 Tax=Agitococcus lubricus TaxID=1077255 RepID=A0A2T5IRU3_9GAMM|nr:hypothetical protein [Agitococcus lubricus]PTQ86527.1 hypothetical protein C8N29_1437 [Agitococcus lubricus]
MVIHKAVATWYLYDNSNDKSLSVFNTAINNLVVLLLILDKYKLLKVQRFILPNNFIFIENNEVIDGLESITKILKDENI